MSESIWLARHAETDWNREGRKQGRRDSPFTPWGEAQIERLVDASSSWGVDRIASSPLARAFETARQVAKRQVAPLVVWQALSEMDFGECSGLTRAEIEAHFPGLLESRRADRWHHRWPGGESYADIEARLRESLVDLAQPGTLIVAHQSVNRVLAWLIAGINRDQALSIDQPADVVLRFDPSDRVWHARLNGASHTTWLPGIPEPGRETSVHPSA